MLVVVNKYDMNKLLLQNSQHYKIIVTNKRNFQNI